MQARAQLIELHLTVYQEIDLDLVKLALFEMNTRVAIGVVVEDLEGTGIFLASVLRSLGITASYSGE